MLVLECLGACPQEKFEKQVLKIELNLGAFQDWTIAVSHFNWKVISDKHDLDISIHKCTTSKLAIAITLFLLGAIIAN